MGFNELMILVERIRVSPEERILKEIEGVQWSVRIFQGNCAEIVRVLKPLEEVDEALELWDRENKVKRHLVYMELGRLFHNFLASAMALVDHSRRHIKKLYHDLPFKEEYQLEVNKRFLNQNSNQGLVKGLRNYTLHRALPIVGSVLQYEEAGGHQRFFQLPIQPLLDWDGWKKSDRASLEGIASGLKGLSIRSFVTQYEAEIVSFYEWLWNRQAVIHREDFDRLNNLRDEAKRAFEEEGYDVSIS